MSEPQKYPVDLLREAMLAIGYEPMDDSDEDEWKRIDRLISRMRGLVRNLEKGNIEFRKVRAFDRDYEDWCY
jgi:hypothetical protein